MLALDGAIYVDHCVATEILHSSLIEDTPYYLCEKGLIRFQFINVSCFVFRGVACHGSPRHYIWHYFYLKFQKYRFIAVVYIPGLLHVYFDQIYYLA